MSWLPPRKSPSPADRELLRWFDLFDYASLAHQLHVREAAVPDRERAVRQTMEHGRRLGIRWDGDGR